MRVMLGGVTRSLTASWPSVMGPRSSMVTRAEVSEGLRSPGVWLRSRRARRLSTRRKRAASSGSARAASAGTGAKGAGVAAPLEIGLSRSMATEIVYHANYSCKPSLQAAAAASGP